MISAAFRPPGRPREPDAVMLHDCVHLGCSDAQVLVLVRVGAEGGHGLSRFGRRRDHVDDGDGDVVVAPRGERAVDERTWRGRRANASRGLATTRQRSRPRRHVVPQPVGAHDEPTRAVGYERRDPDGSSGASAPSQCVIMCARGSRAGVGFVISPASPVPAPRSRRGEEPRRRRRPSTHGCRRPPPP